MAFTLVMFAAALATEPPPVITHTSSFDPIAKIAWTLVTVEGRRLPPAAALPAPRLIAQCSKLPGGKLKFELLADEPGSTAPPPPLTFQGPYHLGPNELFPPPMRRVKVTMEFLGYTQVKPVKREWEYPLDAPTLIRYAPPGATSSHNLEEIAFYLQYLYPLPTLRLTLPNKAAEEFDTTAFRLAVKDEPLCRASGW